MGLYDDILEEQPQAAPQKIIQKNTQQKKSGSGLYDDLLAEQPAEQKPTFAESHPFIASLPETGVTFGRAAKKSYYDFGAGLNDALALAGDKTGIKPLADFGKNNAEFWQERSDDVGARINDNYQHLSGLTDKSTVLPTIANAVGSQATNLLMAAGGGVAAGTAAKAAGLGKVGTGIATTIGTGIPNLAQEGQYLDKIQAFQNVYGRLPNADELKAIQNTAIAEKGINTALETVSDRLLFGKLFPQGAATKGVKGILKSAGEQTLTEGITEGMQEGVSIGAEKLLGINQGDNLSRLGEAVGMGALTGGILGAGATAISQPIDTQLPQAPTEALQNVSAKLVDGGKVLYDSATDTLNNAANAVNGIVNQPTAADVLHQLSREGVFSNNQNIEAIAPNIAEKARTKAAAKSAQSPETIINNSMDTSVENTGMPNLIKEGETLSNLTQDGVSSIVDNTTVQQAANEIQQAAPAESATAVLEKPKTTEKVERKAAAKTRAIEKIKELAPNISAKQELTASEQIKQKAQVPTKLQELAPNMSEKQIVNSHLKEIENVKKSLEKKLNKGEFYENFGQKEIRELRNKINIYDISPENRGSVIEAINSLDNWAQSASLPEGVKIKQKKKVARKTKKSQQVDTSAKTGFDTSIIDKLKNHTATLDESNAAALHYLKLRGNPETVEAAQKLRNLLDAHRIYKENNNVQNNGGTSNGHVVEKVDTNRPSIPETTVTNEETSGRVSPEKSTDERTSDENRREDNASSDGRGISSKHAEIINKEYSNQHELNQAIEKFINDGEYRIYAGSVRMPQAIKNWLKKYAGAGGLEKQGAEGKGLLSEYYTPENIVKKMWDITSQYVNTNGAKVLEPSVGVGRFIEHAPKNVTFDAVEMNPVSARITKILYPDTNVETGEFQERFINKENNTPIKSVKGEYDIVIGNPPYGAYSGRYKGLGEGKKFSRLEAYFINRGLDSLKENGVMTFIVPSSFLDGAITSGKQEIGKKCQLLDAYRLPENTFDTTSIGTDIIVLRKTSGKAETNINLGKWFAAHPEKILGEVQERKSRFGGKMEKYVKGDKNAVDSIDTSVKDIKETTQLSGNTGELKTGVKKTVARKSRTTGKKNLTVQNKGNIEYKEYVPENTVSDEDLKLFNDTRVDGTLPKDKYSPSEKVNMYDGELYNDFNYLQGDIYEKLDALEYEDISEEQKEIQRKKLNKVLPEKKTVKQISFNPTSDFIRELVVGQEEVTEHSYYSGEDRTVLRAVTLDKKYEDYVTNLTNSERNGVSVWDIRKFLDGAKINIDYHYSSYTLSETEKKKERDMQRAEYLTKLKNTVDKTFNDFVRNELTQEQRDKLEDSWNRNFNAVYNPDYKNMPLLIKGLNSEFYGKPLVLQNVQVEGINFLTNKGVGLLGFEVGVGKTLSGIISTVQNMQMGRCKKPLILVPKQVKDNWIREFKETFPNLKINDVDNMSKFDGEVSVNSVTVATYEALGNIWYGENSANELINTIYEVQNDFNRESTKRGTEKAKERAEQLLGLAEKGNKKLHNIQDLGFDHITVDEAHNFKNLFADAKADGQEGNTYVNISGGSTSARAARMFLLSQYILNNNNNRNVFMLTATPFNNSPLEVFNMTSFIGKDKLDKMGLYNVYQFMENYADISSDWIVNSRNEVEYKQVVTGFKNASSLRELIKSVMLIRSAEDAGVQRPDKTTKRVVLEPSQSQLDLIAEAEAEAVTGNKNDGAILKAINQSRKATLSPDIASDNFDVSPEDFVKNSPKIDYIAKAVESMKKKDPKTSQLIYMPLGVKFLPKLKQYFVNKGIFKADEVAIIDSSVSDDKIPQITDSFNDENGKIKLVIGTNKIKEGMNLNKNSSVLYVPYMDWNPTDYMQIVGRIWRRGNRYSKIRVVVPLLKNSSDSFMFQKLNEKTDRINNIMDETKEYIDTSELNTAEEKINMISNPDKKVRMFVKVEQQKLEAKVKELQGRLDTSISYSNSLSENKRMIERRTQDLEAAQKELKNIDPEFNKWNYEYQADRVKRYKKELAEYKYSLNRTQEKIKRLELDFEGKDSEAAINSEIEKVQEQIKQLEEYGKKKLIEYQEEYENERLNSKSVSDLIKEFEKDTEDLYGDNSSSRKSEESKPLGIEPKKRYEKTRENAYNVPVIKLETQTQKVKKSRTKAAIEKAKEVGDARKYNTILKKGIARWHAEINARRYDADKSLNSFINHTRSIAKQIGVNDKNLREIMPFLRERTELPESLNRPELVKVWERVHSEKGLVERITKLADDLAAKFEHFYTEYKAVQASGDFEVNEGGIENYVPHIWDIANKKQKSLLTSHFATKSRFAKERTIDTWYKGINGIQAENGEIIKFTPQTLDYAELFKIQSDNLIKATVDKTLADSVKSMKAENGANLVLPASQAPSDWVEINNSALNKVVVRPVTTKYGEKIAPDLQNKLAEIGIAVGRRLSKYKGNGMPNSLGKYVKNQPPEIRLQRWFSTKTLAHEVGHAMDETLGLQKDNFVTRHRDELIELNRERIEAFAKQGEKTYAERDSELIAELFGVMFNDYENAIKYAPAATSEVVARMTANDKLKSLLPENFDWAEAKHVLEEKVIEFDKIPVKVHPDIASTLKTVFENKKEYLDILGFKPGQKLDNINAIAKMFNFSLSGFHGWALSESYLGNVGISGLKQTLNFKKIYDSVKNNDYDIYKKDEAARQAIKYGLQIGATLDVQRGVAENLINNTGKWIEENIPAVGKPFSLPVKTVGKATELNNKVLWDVIHNNYKLTTYELLVQNEAENGTLTDDKRREIAQWVNDSFGGLVWENLGIAPSAKKTLSRFLMSPDWLISSTRQFFAMFSSKKLHKKMNELAERSDFWQRVKDTTQFFGINSITDNIEASGTRGRIARRFWLRAAIQNLLYMNILNAIFRAWDRDKHPELYPKKMTAWDYSIWGNALATESAFNRLMPTVFAGRNSDGTERHVRFGKQFREVPEMAEDPIKKIGNKFSPMFQYGATIFTGRSMGGFENKEIAEAKGWKRVGVATKQLGETFLPFSVSSAINKKQDYSPFDLVATTSKGMSKYKAGEEFKKAYERGNKAQTITDIEKSMKRNGFSQKDIKTVENRAKGQYLKQFKDSYKQALESGDTAKIKKITENMKKKNVSPIDMTKIYTKALSEYYKSMGVGNGNY